MRGTRILELEGVVNARDLGGLETTDGLRIAERRLFRSGSLHEMTEADRAMLESLGVGTVIDLRSSWERDRNPYRWPEVRLVPAPLVGDERVASIYMRFDAGSLREEDLLDWWGLTRVPDALETHAASIRTIFVTLLELRPNEAALLHCSAGKDRAGLAAAVLLRALGVGMSEILNDFETSNTQLAHLAAELKSRIHSAGGEPLSPTALNSLTGVKREWLIDAFTRLEERHGSFERYLADRAGVEPGDLVGLRNRLLEPASP
jgi:protein-tyrosine phosphatase